MVSMAMAHMRPTFFSFCSSSSVVTIILPSAFSGRRFRAIRRAGQFFSDQRRDFRAVKLDATHDLLVRHRADRHLQQETVIAEHPVGRDDLFGQQFRVADEEIAGRRSEEHTSELQSLMRNSYAVFCLKKKNTQQ